jgi:hypothetical protein
MKPLLDARVAFGDPEIVGLITKADQIRVLESLGWQCRLCFLGVDGEIWVKTFAGEDEESEILVVGEKPNDRVARIGELIHSLARLEKIPVLRLILMLLPGLPIS